MLSDSDDDPQNEDLHKITVNEHYARAFQYRKEREELDKLKEKLGSDISESDLEEDESDSESDVSEDEDGEELTATVDAAILRTLARIRRKDPSIYESGKGVFEEEQEKLASKAAFTVPGKTKKKDKDSSKPVTLRQAALEAQLDSSRSPSPEPLTHVQEQQALQKETISAFHAAAAGNTADDDDDLLVPREKTKDEQEQEEEEYRAYLEREVGDLRDIIGDSDVKAKAEDEPEGHDGEEDGKKKRKNKKKGGDVGKEDDATTTKKRKSKEEEDQEFLMNYILNRGWIDKSKDRVPTYHEVTTSKPDLKKSKSKSKATLDTNSDHAEDEEDASKNGDSTDSDSDASFESLADAFESSYNFRFEEPNSSTIPSFPRSIPSLVRREDTKRKDARERRKQRKEEEMEKRREEVRRLKALKMREVRRKLELVGRQGGILGAKGKTKEGLGVDEWEVGDGEMDEALRELDLEGDWDPEKHDAQMAGLFAGGEGDVEEEWDNADEVDEDGKPVWNDDIDIGDIHVSDDDAVPMGNTKKDKKKKKKKKKKGGEEEQEDEGVDIDAMDADVQALKKELGEEEEWDGTEEMRKRKLDEYMEEVYNLDFNDMVGDLPTRFKYTPVAPQSYSLTPVEILLATDKELNEFMSVKRYAPYKTDARKWDAKRQQKLKDLKSALAGRSKTGGWLVKDSANGTSGASGSGSRAGNAQGEGEQKAKRRKGKKERMRAKAAAAEGEGEGEGERERDDETENTVPVADGSSSNGANGAGVANQKPKKDKLEKMATDRERLKGHKRKADEIEGAEAEVQEPQELEQDDENGKPKKKRRRKHNKKSGGDGGSGD